MRIGIDFDNTIVSYDALFHRVALEKNLIPPSLPESKLVVRDYLRKVGNEDLWTLIQGEVYGTRMGDAIAYPGFFKFLKQAHRSGHKIFIISHKTRYPFAGPNYDLHKAAKNWISKSMPANGIEFNQSKDAYFEVTKEDKISRIAQLNCDVFIDDLPEILAMPGYPDNIQKILFNADGRYLNDFTEYIIALSWKNIENHLIK